MQLHAKSWITKDGVIVFGAGRARLLEAIHATGSISAAARRMDMSYRHAWTLLKTAEERIGRPLLHRSKGGAGGGGAKLTALAKTLLKTFRVLESDMAGLVKKENRRLSNLLSAKRLREIE